MTEYIIKIGSSASGVLRATVEKTQRDCPEGRDNNVLVGTVEADQDMDWLERIIRRAIEREPARLRAKRKAELLKELAEIEAEERA